MSTSACAQEDSVKVASQNPSPMVESARQHERIKQQAYPGVSFEVSGILARPVQVFIPEHSRGSMDFDLLVHFHGASYVVQHSASKHRGNIIAASVNLGSGSKVYNDAFEDTTRFQHLIDSVVTEARGHLESHIKVRRLILSGFSAGYGAIRKIISSEDHYATVDAVLLLDGIHASYIPEREVLAHGGRIDSSGLLPYLKFARDASRKSSRKRFLITHSEIFPGTFVSTTEATDWLLRQLDIRRYPVLKWGPLGMQQLSEARRGHFTVLGFAGNSAPDHIDHFHSLYWFLNELMKL
ncbi:MAG: hypothetical protein FJ217_06915 [Ignavibacteria bacterium]|nr:hypothetical protein [Ignavibacteria bacterium]